MSLTAAGLELTIRGRDGGLEIRPGLPRLTRAGSAVQATEALRARTARRVLRTAELTSQGWSARQIGRQVAADEGSAEPFSPSTVKQWRRRARGRQLDT